MTGSSIQAGAIAFANLAGGIKVDGGQKTFAATVTGVSTRLSSILAIVGTFEGICSGVITIMASGHAFDISTYSQGGATYNVSTKVNWLALGN